MSNCREPSLFDNLNPPDPCARRHRRRPTSTAAHDRTRHTYGRVALAILKLIAAEGDHGATLDEVSVRIGRLPHTISPRFSQLTKFGLIKQHGTRPTRSNCPAAVHVATALGISALQAETPASAAPSPVAGGR